MTDATTDPFARVAEERATNAVRPGPQPSVPSGRHVDPVPEGAPRAPIDRRGVSRVWAYHSQAGELRFYIMRFEGRDGAGKRFQQLTLWEDGGRLEWRWKAPPAPRSLYRLPELVRFPDRPILIVEGEKAADAAALHFRDLPVLSWPGGSNGVGKADWSPLQGRDVIVWPDADVPGAKAANAVRAQALAAGARRAAIVEIPDALPLGWDLADPWPAGFGLPAALAALDDAREALTAPPAATAAALAVEWPYGFRMEAEGLFYDQPTKEATVAQRLSAPFEVLAEAREHGGAGWAVVIRFRDRDGREKTFPVSRARLASGSAEVRAELADAGLIVSPARGKADKFSIALAEVRCTRRMTLAGSTGWCGDRFVLPVRTVGPADGEDVLFTGDPRGLHYGQAGDLDGWRTEIAAKAVGNDLLTFALSLAFAGPLLRPLGLEGGGVHFRGPSSCGKTTLAFAAGSVWGGGGPLGFGHSWRNTANALEGVAAGHCDSLLVLDELSLVAPEEAGGAAYALASGQAKGRAQTTGLLRRRAEWRIMLLSTGEIGLADHIRAGRRGERPMAGQELRLLDLAADGGVGRGVWQELHDAESAAALSDALKASCRRHYGHAGPAFLEAFLVDRDRAAAAAKEILKVFLERARERGDTGQAERAAIRFGAIAAAGELAAAAGVAPWDEGAALTAALALYRRWAAAFGRAAPRELREILSRLRNVIESERSAFSPLGDEDVGETTVPSPGGRDGEARSLRTYGFRWVRGAEIRYCFHAPGWAEVLQGFNPQEAARLVADAGFLETDNEKTRLTKKVKVRGEPQRLYCVRSSIVESDD